MACSALSDISGVSIWNPHTRELKKIPHCPPDTNNLAKLKGVRYGLAYDSVSDDYKVLGVIKFYNLQAEIALQFKIYSLKMDSCRRKIKDACPYENLAWNFMAVVNGAIHWISCYNIDSPFGLVALDIANEKFKEFVLPESLCKPNNRTPILCKLEGKLCLFERSKHFVSLWLMEENGMEQTRKKILSIPRKVFLSNIGVPLHLFEDGTVMIYEYRGQEEQVIRYKDGRLVCRSTIADCYTLCAYIGLETLISPHMSNERKRLQQS